MDIQIIINRFLIKNEQYNQDTSIAVSIILPCREHYLFSRKRIKMIQPLDKLVDYELKSLANLTNVDDIALKGIKRTLFTRYKLT